MGLSSKRIILLLIILLIIVTVGFMQFYDSDDYISVGKVSFKIPNGYQEGIKNSVGDINLTNGTNCVFIAVYEDGDINPYVNEMAEFVKSTNRTPIISNQTICDKLVSKMTIVDDVHSIFYWFEDNGEVFSVYTWDGNNGLEEIVFDFIESLNSSN